MQGKPPYDRPFVNFSGEAIPGFAVLEVGGWVDDQGGVSVFKAVKPTKDGKMYLVNGPLPVQPGRKGWAARAPNGLWVLYGGTATPTLNQEYGPKAGQWSLWADGKGGFIVVDDPRGSSAPAPGFPVGTSTKRIRVWEQAKAKVTNRIQGTAASSATPQTPVFLVNKITVLSGVDPRQTPGSPIEAIQVQNNLLATYTNGVDRITATQSEADQKWYVETVPAAESVIFCEAIEDKGYQNPKCLAKPVMINGAIDAAATAFYLVDDLKAHFLRKATSDGAGYRCHAVQFTKDYQDGIPGYRIIASEGPALRMIVKLGGSYIAAGTSCTVQPQKIYGSPTRGRRLPPSGAVVVVDPLVVAADAKLGDVWEVAFDEETEKYIFMHPIGVIAPMIPAIAIITQQCPVMTEADLSGSANTATPGVSADTAATIVKWSTTLPAKLSPDSRYQPMGVLNLTMTEINATTSNAGVYGGFIQSFKDPDAPSGSAKKYRFVAVGPREIRMLKNFIKSTAAIAWHDTNDNNEQVYASPCP